MGLPGVSASLVTFLGGQYGFTKAGKAVVQFLACCPSCAFMNREQQTHSGLRLHPWTRELRVKCWPGHAEVSGITFIASSAVLISHVVINDCLHLLVWIHRDI